MKRLDQLSTEVLKNALQFTGKLNMVAPVHTVTHERPAQHQPGVLIATAYDSNYVACLDPLDGSGNADAAICTGTVFGVFDSTLGEGVLQPGQNMRAAGYCLYSSATVLVFSLGDGKVQGFTLDPRLKEFVLTHPNLTIPPRGTVYSCNEANSEGWSDEFKAYLTSLKKGEDNETHRRYAHRYVGSMVGDIHRTLLYGGIFCYPSDSDLHPHGNLQLLYKSAPMAFIVNQAGGKSIDEHGGDLLHVQPKRIHQKSPCFIGSPDDVNELKKYLVVVE
jgi:fructose-1,6-bisphosphatase I